jgi:hypothetical protein
MAGPATAVADNFSWGLSGKISTGWEHHLPMAGGVNHDNNVSVKSRSSGGTILFDNNVITILECDD